jgi:hypothetical protein
MDAPRLMAPTRGCGHRCVCAACAFNLEACPLCRAPVEEWQAIYI